MFLHCVYYWMKADLTESERETFLQGIDSLTRLSSVRSAWFGKPADTDRPVIDRSYDYALVLILKDSTGHDAFQADTEHHSIRNLIGSLWKKILIYDFEN